MGSGSVTVNGGVYINNNGIETFLKNIKDISDSFDNIQKRIKNVKNSLESDFDGITPMIIDYAQTCVDLSDKLKKNADYIHTKSQKIVKIADDAEINALAQFDALEAIKQRIAALLASVGSFVTLSYGLGEVKSFIGDLLGGGSGNSGHGIGFGNSSYGGSSYGGGGSGGDGNSEIGPKVEFFHRSKDNKDYEDSEFEWFSDASYKYKYDAQEKKSKEDIGVSIFSKEIKSKEDSVSLIHITDEDIYDKFSTKLTADVLYAGYSANSKFESGFGSNGIEGKLEMSVEGSAKVASANREFKFDDIQSIGGMASTLSINTGIDIGSLNADGKISVDKDGISGEVNVGASAAKIEVGATYETESIYVNKASVKAEAEVIAAGASGKFKAGKDGFEAKGEAEASFAKATATGKVDILGGIFTLEGTAGVNAGLKAGAGASAENGKLKLGAEAAALGDVGFAVTVNADVIASEDNQWYTKFSEGYEKTTGHSYKDDWYTGMDVILDSNPLGRLVKDKVILNGY